MSPSFDTVPRRIAVVPAYNEQETVVAVLSRLAPLVDLLIVVDDGSTDRTRREVERWLPGQPNVELLWFDQNRGMSAAYHLAFSELRRRLERGELDADDLICTVDADGQHDLDALDTLVETATKEGLDALLACRDLSEYPAYKQFGNRVMSVWATFWAGVDLPDVESGYRVFRLGALADALNYYSGYKYSETVEVAVVLARLGYRVRNDVRVSVPVFRSRTSMVDAVIDLSVIPAAWWRVMRHQSRLVGFGIPVAAATTIISASVMGRALVRGLLVQGR